MRDTSKAFVSRISFSLLALLALLAFDSSCGVERLPTVTVAPEAGSTDQPLDVLVMATFSRSVSDMGPWENLFTLRKDNAGDNLCTDYNVSSDVTNVQCVHDDLEPSSSYTIIVQHPQSSGITAAFSTASS